MNKETILKQIADELGSANIYEDYVSQTRPLASEKTRIGVLGQANVGKTTLINALLGTSLPTSNIPSGISHNIAYGQGETTARDGFRCVMSDCEWLKQHNAEVFELNKDIVADNFTQVDVCRMLSCCDVCIYLLNAQAALDRTDLFVLQNLDEVNIPTLLVFSRGDLLSEDDFAQVADYVKGNLKKLARVEVLPRRDMLTGKDRGGELRSLADALLAKADVAASRASFENFYLGYALSRLFAVCQEKIDACLKKQDDLERLALEKQAKLNEKTNDWLKVETRLRQRTGDIADKLRALLDNRKADMLRQLTHDVDVFSGDLKLFWEKDFPFRLENMMRADVQSATQMINQELIRTMQWLQDELLKQFRCKMSLATSVVGNTEGKAPVDAGINIADTNRLKIVTRIGTAATVIAAGTLLATAGIGGVVMAVGMVSGLGAEFFMRKKNNEAKEEIKRHLPDIVTRAQLQVVTDFAQKLQEVTGELIAHLQTLKADWLETSRKEIDQELSIAKFNFSSAKWENVMGRINQLTEIILK